MQRVVSEFDLVIYRKIRDNVSRFIEQNAEELDSSAIKILDIAPQDHTGANKVLSKRKCQQQISMKNQVPITLLIFARIMRTNCLKNI